VRAPPAGRRRTALALGLASAIGLTACGSSETKTVTVQKPAGTTSTETAPKPAATTRSEPTRAPSEAPVRTVHTASFLSPTGNIGCSIAGGVARCDIAKRSWSPPARPSTCPSEVDFGQGIQVGRSAKAAFVCAGDTSRAPGSAKLPYGTGSEVEGFVCVSRESGMSCNRATTGHGFTISTQGYKLF
jgi:hypothetical protein